MLKKLKRLFFGFDYEPFELFSSMLLVSWGTWLYYVSDFTASASFVAMSDIADEYSWGTFMMLLGLIYFLFVVFDDHEGISYKIRKFLAIIAIVTWTFISIMLFLSNTGTVGTVTYFVIALFNFWAYVRLK